MHAALIVVQLNMDSILHPAQAVVHVHNSDCDCCIRATGEVQQDQLQTSTGNCMRDEHSSSRPRITASDCLGMSE